MKYKIAIIGSGIGGLTCGNLLARKGHMVTLFEAHGSPGGYTAGFRRRGYYFESGTLAFESSNQVFPVMKDLGVFDRIAFVRKKTRFCAPEYDGIPESYDDFKSLFYDGFAVETARLDKYFSQVDRLYKAMTGLRRPGSIWSALTYPFRILNFLGVMKRYGSLTLTDFTARYFDRESTLFRYLKSFGYPDMNAFILGGAIYTLLHDYWTVKDGMQSWADVLAENFQRLGGDLALKTPVEKILIRGGRATGVAASGNTYEADWVISAADYKKTFLRLLEDPTVLPPAFRAKVEQASVSEGFFTVYLGLAMNNTDLQRHLKTFHVSYTDERPGVDVTNDRDEAFFEKTSVTLYSPSLLNPALAPSGRSSLMIQAVCPHHWMDNWGKGDRERYRILKAKAKSALITKASAIVPGLRERVEFEDAATPLTYERYTGNTDGATSAWSWNPTRRFYKNSFQTYIETPIKNLLIGSCWASQIGGVPGAIAAALRCNRKIG